MTMLPEILTTTQTHDFLLEMRPILQVSLAAFIAALVALGVYRGNKNQAKKKHLIEKLEESNLLLNEIDQWTRDVISICVKQRDFEKFFLSSEEMNKKLRQVELNISLYFPNLNKLFKKVDNKTASLMASLIPLTQMSERNGQKLFKLNKFDKPFNEALDSTKDLKKALLKVLKNKIG